MVKDWYSVQSEGRTPGDEDSCGVDDGHIEVMHWTQQTCGEEPDFKQAWKVFVAF